MKHIERRKSMITAINRHGAKIDLISYGRYGSISQEWYVRGFNDNDYCFDHYEKTLKELCDWCNLSQYKLKQLIRVDFT